MCKSIIMDDNKTVKNSQIIRIMLLVLFSLLPLFVVLSIALARDMNLLSFTVSDISIPALANLFNDEVAWINQTVAVVEYGKPLGYWGYNGMHAQIGTFGAWGVPMVYLLSLPLKLLSVFFSDYNHGYYLFVNLFWACLANGIFLILAKPSSKQVIRLCFVYAFLYVNHCFIFTGMSETTRFSLGIILAGLVVFMMRKPTGAGCRAMIYIGCPVIIILCMSAYIMYCPVLLVWFYAVHKNSSKAHQRKLIFWIAACIAFFVVTAAVFLISGLYESPYFASTIKNLLSAFKEDFFLGIKTVIKTIKYNLSLCSVSYIFATDPFCDFFKFYVPLYYGIVAYLTVTAFLNRKKYSREDMEYRLIALSMLIMFFVAFVVLYTTTFWILARGINIALVFAMYLLCMTKSSNDIKVFVVASLLGLYPFLLLTNNMFLRGRNDVSEFSYKSTFEQHLNLSETADPWENTVALYGDIVRPCLDFPIGTAINLMVNKDTDTNAKYAMIWKGYVVNTELAISDPDALIEELKSKYNIVYSDDNLVLMAQIE